MPRGKEIIRHRWHHECSPIQPTTLKWERTATNDAALRRAAEWTTRTCHMTRGRVTRIAQRIKLYHATNDARHEASLNGGNRAVKNGFKHFAQSRRQPSRAPALGETRTYRQQVQERRRKLPGHPQQKRRKLQEAQQAVDKTSSWRRDKTDRRRASKRHPRASTTTASKSRSTAT
jgi:hypothetical protein